MEYTLSDVLLMAKDNDAEKRKYAASHLIEYIDYKNADEIVATLLDLSYDKNGYVRACSVQSFGKVPSWMKEHHMKEITMRLLMMGDVYTGYFLPRTLGQISSIVPEPIKNDVVVKLYDLLKLEHQEMLIERHGSGISGALETFESREDTTIEMKKEVINALKEYRKNIPLNIEEGIVKELMEFLKKYSGWDIKYVIIEFLKGINPRLPEHIRTIICDKVIEFASDREYIVKLNGIETIEKLYPIVPPEIKERVNKQITEIILNAIDSRDWTLKISSMSAGAKIFHILSRDSRVDFIRTLLSNTKDSQWIVRMTVAKTLNAIKAGIPDEMRAEIAREAISLTRDRDWSVRMFAIELIGDAYNSYFPVQYRKEAMDNIIKCTSDGNRNVRDFARRALELIEQGV